MNKFGQSLLIIYKKIFTIIYKIGLLVQFYIFNYSLIVSVIISSIATLFLIKLLYFDLTWAGFLMDILDKIINYFDKVVGYEPVSVNNELKPATTTTSNFTKLLSLGKKVVVWVTVGGFCIYGSLYLAGVSFGLAKIFLMLTLPLAPVSISEKVPPVVLVCENNLWYEWW